MALHGSLPVSARADARILWCRADRGGVEQHLGAQQRHGARRFRKPLVPADRYAELGVARVEHLETGIARREIELLVVSRTFRYMRLAVASEHRPVGIDDDDGIVECVVGAFEYADRQDDAEVARHSAKMFDRGMRVQRLGKFQMAQGMVLAEVRRLEQFLDQNHLRAAARRYANKFLSAGDIRVPVPTARHLSGGHGYFAHRSYATSRSRYAASRAD